MNGPKWMQGKQDQQRERERKREAKNEELETIYDDERTKEWMKISPAHLLFLNHDEDERNIQMETSAQLFKTFKNYIW